MAIEVKLEVFEGPLDLCLSLVKSNKMSIDDIQISVLCDQYIAYITKAEEMDIELSSEFLLMASELMLIKSRMLLPRQEEIEEEKEKDEMPLLNVETHIEDNYVDDNNLKIEIHKKINEIDSYEKLQEVKNELEDRFGKISDNLVTYMYEEWFEKIAKKLCVEKVIETKTFIEIIFSKETSQKIDGEKLFMDAFNISHMFRFKMQHDMLSIILDTVKLEENYVLLIAKLLSTITIQP